MTKPLLHHKLVSFQQRIISLTDELRDEKKRCQDAEEQLLLELLTVLDAFENVFSHLEGKESIDDPAARRGMKSFRAIHRKLMRLLDAKDVVQLTFSEELPPPMEWCQVSGTEVAGDKEEGVVLSVIKEGYRRGDRILRAAEVITAANRS